MYHLVCPAKYRRDIFRVEVEKTLKEVCIEIGKWYEINFLEIGADEDHVHFLVQGISVLAPERIVQIIKGITAKEIFKRHPEVKKKLWGGRLWSGGYYMNTVGRYGNEKVIKEYIANQGGHHRMIYQGQLELFDRK